MGVNRIPPAKLVWEDNYLVRQEAFRLPPSRKSLLDYILCRTRI